MEDWIVRIEISGICAKVWRIRCKGDRESYVGDREWIVRRGCNGQEAETTTKPVSWLGKWTKSKRSEDVFGPVSIAVDSRVA